MSFTSPIGRKAVEWSSRLGIMSWEFGKCYDIWFTHLLGIG